jgi:hypothetical protein
MTTSPRLLTGFLCTAALLAAAPSQANVRPGPPGHPPPPPLWLCPVTAPTLMTLNGVCVATPTSVAVAKAQPAGGGSPGAGAAHRPTTEPKIIVAYLGGAFSPTLSSWAHAGGPPAKVVITSYGAGHVVEHTVTLERARPVKLTGGADAALTLSY